MGLNSKDFDRLGPAAKKQVLQKLGAQQLQRESKYHNEPDSRGELRFDSKKEARRYDELMLRLRAGRIQDLKLQHDFTLQEAYTTPDGKRVQAIRYRADFTYFDCDRNKEVVEDVKSQATKTRVYSIKKKLMLEKFGLEIEEV